MQVQPSSEWDEAGIHEGIQLATSLYDRFEETGQISDLEIAMSAYQSLSDHLPLQHAIRPFVVASVLSNTIHLRFKQTGHLSDLHDAV
jgi:hypothetical protein